MRTIHPVAENIRAMVELEQKALGGRTALHGLTDTIARVAGSTPFIVLHAVGFVVWNAFNATRFAFDAFPYSLLNLVVALEAVLLTSVVLMTQNHMTRLADRRAHLDRRSISSRTGADGDAAHAARPLHARQSRCRD